MNHEHYMQRCLELAQRGRSQAAPNPMVGAILVHNNRIIGEGWHERYGKAHAEVNCLNSVAENDKQLIPESTMYVSLEPCAHYGKTPPCANRIVAEKVKEVIICNIDPFEKVDGNGISILNNAGVNVETSILDEQGRWMNRRFFCFHQQQRPYIILKWAESAEGNIAAADLSRTQLSNYFSSVLVHQWRTEEAAIMVGYNTALKDNPQLTSRHWIGPQPLRIVLDRNLSLPETLSLFDKTVPTWIVNQVENKISDNLELVEIPFDDQLLPSLLKKLHANNKLSLFIEGGAALLNSFIKAGLWDEARIFNTNTSLPNGLAAPQIENGRLVAEMPVADDTLRVFTNNNSIYPYVDGCTL